MIMRVLWLEIEWQRRLKCASRRQLLSSESWLSQYVGLRSLLRRPPCPSDPYSRRLTAKQYRNSVESGRPKGTWTESGGSRGSKTVAIGYSKVALILAVRFP